MIKCERAGALILNKNMDKCLMVFQKSSKLWGVPKGRKEDYEDNYLCMIREVKEEVGLNLNKIKLEVLDSVFIHKKALIYIIKIFLDPLPICSPPFEDGKENHEIEKIEWVPLHEAYTRKVNSITKNAFASLRKYISSRNNSLIKSNKYDEDYNFILDDPVYF